MTDPTRGTIGRALAGLLAQSVALALSPMLYAVHEARAADESETELAKKTQVAAYYNAGRPKDTADSQLRFPIQFVFPK
jgi:hypothetical protein